MYVYMCWVGQKNSFRFLYSVTEKLELFGQPNILNNIYKQLENM